MKTLKQIGFIATVCFATITFTSCQKEIVGPKGDPGVAGVTGTKGATGDAGATGETGPQGERGSAGLSVSSTYFSVDTWVYDLITKEYQGYILDNRIKQAVIDGGGVQVYLQSANNQFTALPATTYTAPGASYKLGYAVSLQQVKIELQYPNLQQGPFPGSLRFKVVVFSSDFIDAHKTLDLKNYDEVKKYIGE